jgi:hypothetical protein
VHRRDHRGVAPHRCGYRGRVPQSPGECLTAAGR